MNENTWFSKQNNSEDHKGLGGSWLPCQVSYKRSNVKYLSNGSNELLKNQFFYAIKGSFTQRPNAQDPLDIIKLIKKLPHKKIKF